MEPHLRATGCHLTWNHTVIPATRHNWTDPALTPATQAGTRFTCPGGTEAWVHLSGRDGLPAHPSTSSTWPGVERVRRPNHYTTKPDATVFMLPLYVEINVFINIFIMKNYTESTLKTFKQLLLVTNRCVNLPVDILATTIRTSWINQDVAELFSLEYISTTGQRLAHLPPRGKNKLTAVIHGNGDWLNELAAYCCRH